MLRNNAKKGLGAEVLGTDGERRKSHVDANCHVSIAVANPLVGASRHGHPACATFEEVFSLAATRATTDRIGRGTMAVA